MDTKRKPKIFSEVEKITTSEKRLRMRCSTYEDLEKACYKWLLNARNQNIPVSGNILKVKALYFAKELGCDDTFKASDGWLDRPGKGDAMFRFKQCKVSIYLFICVAKPRAIFHLLNQLRSPRK